MSARRRMKAKGGKSRSGSGSMRAGKGAALRFQPASDQSILVYLGERIGLASHERVVRLLRLLERDRIPWVRNLNPAYCSLLVTFDSCAVTHEEVEETLRSRERAAESLPAAAPRRIEIPVCYGGEWGPDLDEVATLHGVTPERVIELHSSQAYRAYFLGFTPGFAYLGDVPDEIATPRHATPRKSVPAGSVGIAGTQTGVYPFATPGGWRIIGRTPLEMFRTDRRAMGLIAVGDEVRFVPVSADAFQRAGA